MLSVDFGTYNADNLVWKERVDLTETVPDLRFKTPEKFVESSLSVVVNGQTLIRSTDNGFTVLSDEEFELKMSLHTTGALAVSYLTA